MKYAHFSVMGVASVLKQEYVISGVVIKPSSSKLA